jgi:hypothetical protein
LYEVLQTEAFWCSCQYVDFGKLKISQDSFQVIDRPSFKIFHCNQDFSGNSAEWDAYLNTPLQNRDFEWERISQGLAGQILDLSEIEIISCDLQLGAERPEGPLIAPPFEAQSLPAV